jgi:hypothetical protein
MLDATQILLLILIVVIGGTLVLVGIQFYFILRELKKSLESVNTILEEFQESASNITAGTQHVRESMKEMQEMAQNVKEGLKTPVVSGLATFGLVRSFLKSYLEDDDESLDEEE